VRPVEPAPSRWRLEAPPDEYDHDLWAVGADLEPGTVLTGYRLGLFPMPVRQDDEPSETIVGWWSPAHRGVIPLERRPPRTLRRVGGRFEIRIDTAFDEVMRGCADPSRPHGWIDDSMLAAYRDLHALGWAHSVECWDEEGLAGGLYGVSLGGLFAAESMFQVRSDAAKCAVLALVTLLQAAGDAVRRVLDVQWCTPHLALLGATEVSRPEYRRRLADALGLEPPAWPRASGETRDVVRQPDEEE
jgi:leucyl/phenylalanyl-tRNA--protein transferase